MLTVLSSNSCKSLKKRGYISLMLTVLAGMPAVWVFAAESPSSGTLHLLISGLCPGFMGVMPHCWGFLPYRKTCNCAKREAKDYCAHKN
jgi:hypothetical protein